MIPTTSPTLVEVHFSDLCFDMSKLSDSFSLNNKWPDLFSLFFLPFPAFTWFLNYLVVQLVDYTDKTNVSKHTSCDRTTTQELYKGTSKLEIWCFSVSKAQVDSRSWQKHWANRENLGWKNMDLIVLALLPKHIWMSFYKSHFTQSSSVLFLIIVWTGQSQQQGSLRYMTTSLSRQACMQRNRV